jgi:hypothetical protein
MTDDDALPNASAGAAPSLHDTTSSTDTGPDADEAALRRRTVARNIDVLAAVLIVIGCLGALIVLNSLYVERDALVLNSFGAVLLPVGLGLRNRESWACSVATGLAVLLALFVACALPIGLLRDGRGPGALQLVVATAISGVLVHRLLRLLHRAHALGLFPTARERFWQRRSARRRDE